MNKFLKKIEKRKFTIITFVLVFILIAIALLPSAFSQMVPVSEILINSSKLDYSHGDQGSWQIKKEAHWISKGKARITFTLDSVIKTHKEYNDVILVLDTSGSMNESIKNKDGQSIVKLEQLKSDTIGVIRSLLADSNNRIALVDFNTSSTIVSEFTNNVENLVDAVNGLSAEGNTNYYQALKNVDILLKNYQKESNHDCVVLFFTDGYPNSDSPNELAQYNYLKSEYPFLTINGVQYEMGDTLASQLSNVSDYQFNANVNNLNSILYAAAVSPVDYDSFKITDYIDSRYFNVNKEEISVTSGSFELNNNSTEPEIIWNLDGVKTGFTEKMYIDVSLNNDLLNVGGIYPTNTKEVVNSELNGKIESVTSTKTPILADNYKVIYESNSPEGCLATNVPSNSTQSVFDSVEVSPMIPVCENYKFSGWEIINEDVKMLGSNHFEMPEEDVTIRAKWSKLSLNKSMNGQIAEAQTLYQLISSNAVLDNKASDFVSNSISFGAISSDTNGKGLYEMASTKDNNYPIYYYRGDINNNNLRFANFCWKIVRTTDTGGVKIVYNGTPNDDGSCTASGSDVHIGTNWINNSNSIAYEGYMYGKVYSTKDTTGSIVGIGGKTESKLSDIETSNYIYSENVTYDQQSGLYTLVDGENRVWNDTYAVGDGNQYLYTCLSESDNTCSEVKYVTRSNDVKTINYTTFTNGEVASTIENYNIVYGNDVTYDSTTGEYTLKNTMTSKIKNWKDDYEKIAGKTESGYHYSCFSEDDHCSNVNYIYFIDKPPVRNLGSAYYITLTNGKLLSQTLTEMTTDSTNENSSGAKSTIDTWYAKNLIKYGSYLEDTVWCNDRTIQEYAGWDKDGNALNYLYFKAGQNLDNLHQPVLTCDNKTFSYTVSDSKGNGKLTYPIALLTGDEVTLAGGRVWKANSNFYLWTGTYWWTMTPYYFGGPYGANSLNLYANGDLDTSPIYYGRGIRPAVSLKPGIRTIDGDGSTSNPFVIE